MQMSPMLDAQTALRLGLTKLRGAAIESTHANGPAARAGLVAGDVIQKVGRGSRIRQPDGTLKESFEVYDIDDRGCGCGVRGEPTSYLHKSCEWLERHSRLRRAAYEKFGYKPMEFQ
jgi:hypothetical protein